MKRRNSSARGKEKKKRKKKMKTKGGVSGGRRGVLHVPSGTEKKNNEKCQ